MSPGKNWLLNVGLVASTACAAALLYSTATRVWRTFSEERGAMSKQIPEWRTLAASGHRMGPADAPVSIVVFSDFQCAFCARQAPILTAIRERFPNDVAVVYRHMPWEAHEFARPAAIASECAAQQGRFQEYHDALFAESDFLGVVSWTDLATRAGVSDLPRFVECIENPSTGDVVERDVTAAQSIPVFATPTLIVNDTALAGLTEFEVLDQFVQAELATAEGAAH